MKELINNIKTCKKNSDSTFSFSRYFVNSFFGNKREETFNKIYEKKMWGNQGDLYFSGRGSIEINSREYAEYVQNFILKNNISTVVDIGCGDFRVGKQIDLGNSNYIGIDIVKKLIDYNNKNFRRNNITFLHRDVVTDNLPDADLCLIRQVFQHLSNKDISEILKKTKKYKYVLVTDGLPLTESVKKNVDKPTDHNNRWNQLYNSGLYLEYPPFNLNVKIVLNYISNPKKERFRTLLIQN